MRRIRLNSKWSHVASQLRQRIVTGDLTPGSRLPTRPEISRAFNISQGTAQAVMDALSRDRFIETRGRHGTFVSDHPPHLTHFGVVYPWEPGHLGVWSKFHNAIKRAAEVWVLPPHCTSTVYFGTQETYIPHYRQQLLDDVERDLVAGLIFATTPWPYLNTPILTRPGLPRVAIMDASDHLAMPRVYVDFDDWFDKAFEQVRLTGHKRVATLLSTGMCTHGDDDVRRHAAHHGLAIPRQWMQYVPARWDDASPMIVRRTVELLMSGKAHERPQALVVGDDNLLDEALKGIMGIGLQPGRDVTIVTHCNLPDAGSSAMPSPGLIRVGFDVPAILRACVQSIADQRKGLSVPACTLVPAQVVREVTALVTVPDKSAPSARIATGETGELA